MNLDITTLMLVLSLGNFLQVMALLVQWRWVKTYRGPGWWTLGTALVGLGFLAAYLRAVPGWVALAIVATNLLIVGGHICFYVGVLRFFDQREPRGPMLVALALYTAMVIYLTYGDDDVVPRRAMLYLVLAAVSWLGVRALMRYKSRSASGSADFLAAVFLAHGGALMAGALFTVTRPPDPNVLAASAGHLMPALEALISTTLSTFGFILLLNQRLNAELSAAQRDRELIFNTSPDAVTITRLSDGQLVDMNDGFTALTGFTRAEARGRSTLDLSLWKYPADRQKVIAVVTQQGHCDNLEAVFQHQDGSELIGLISAQRLMLQDEPHLLSVIRDITPYKQAEVARRESEARFRNCFDQPLIGIAISGMDKAWLEVNDRLCAMLGYTREALLDTTWVALTHPEDRAADVDQFDRVQRGECDSYSLTKRFIRRDGQTITVDLSVACVRTAEGVPQYFVALFQDVTQRQVAEQALRASEEKFRLAFAYANTGMCLVDLQGQLLQVNAKMSAILGYSQPELIGMTVNTLTLPDDLPLSESFIQEALEGHRDSATFEKRYRHRDGQVVYGQVATSLVRDAGGQPLYFISQVQDITERQRAEAALRHEQIFSQAVIDSIPGIFYVFDENGHYLRWNARQRDLILGHLDDERLSQTPALESVHPEDRDRIGAHVADLFATGKNQAVAGRVLLRGGPDCRWFLLNGQRLIINGKPYLVGTGLDITDQRQAEERLRESEAQFKALADTSPLAIYLSEGIEQRFEYINPTGVRLFGYTREEIPMVGQWWPLAYPEARYRHAVEQEWQRRVEHAIAMGSAIEPMETVVTCKDGSLKHILWGYQSIGARNYAFGLDLTERRQAEREITALNAQLEARIVERTDQLATTEERLRLAMDATRDGVWDWNVPTGVSVCNDAYFSMLGYTRQELGAAFQSLFVPLLHPDERDKVLSRIQDSLADPGHYAVEFRMRGKDGQYRWIASRGKVVERDTAGAALRVIGTHSDITERKVADLALLELNEKLEQKVTERTAELAQAKAAAEMAARAKGEFLANMSHEIRTPMNAILGLTQLLERDTLTPDQQDLLHKISDAGAGLLHIINDILDFSKIEAGQMSLDYQPFDLGGLLRQVESLLAGSAADKDLALELQRPEGLTEQLLGDGLRIKQILVNLASNALKFTERGRIELRVIPQQVTDTALRLRFEVSDTGIGISPEALVQLFQPFTQADASTTRRFGGTGLGLSISKRLVELMGGTIGARSTPGAGSTFWFELPLARVAAETPTRTPHLTASMPAPPRGPRLSGLRVLGVDDNRLNLFLLERALQLEGASVHLAADGQQALQTLQANPQGFDVVLMDIQMPVMDGLTATREIRADVAIAHLPVIAMTAGVLAEERAAAEAAGVDEFLAKPLDLGQMVTMLLPYAPPQLRRRPR